MTRQNVKLIENNDIAKKISEKNINMAVKEAKGKRNPSTRRRIAQESVYSLASCMLPIDDICTILDCNPEYLYRRFGKTIGQARGETKKRLAFAMHKKAIEQDNAQMQIWLSKQHLGYRESVAENHQPIAIQINIQDIPA